MTMTVGELSKTAGVNLETVRYYEKQKLLPSPERTSGGHRLYTHADVERLKFILRAKGVGFTLKEIRTLMRVREANPTDSCDDVMELARRKRAEIDTKLIELRTIRDALDTFIESCPEIDAARCQVLHGLETAEHRHK